MSSKGGTYQDPITCTSFIFFKEEFTDAKRDELQAISNRFLSSISVEPGALLNIREFEYIWRWLIFKRIVSDNEDNHRNLFVDDEFWGEFERKVNQIKAPLNKKKSIIPSKIKIAVPYKDPATLTELSPEVEVDLGNNKGAPYQSFMLLIDEAEAALAKVNRTDIPYYIFIDELEAYYGNRQIFERDLALIRDLIFTVKRFNTIFAKSHAGKTKIICSVRSEISPLVQAYKGNNDFEVLKIVKEYSPLMESKKWISLDDQTKALQQVESAVDKLMELWKDDAIPTCLDVLRSIQDTGLFKLDERVDNILSSPAADESIRITALRKALSVPFTTLEKYFAYVSDNTRFATHQGVKGLEFPRVMVIIDDAEAKGFLFSYEKLFGVKLKTETDIKNEREGKDNSITRTTRLFYVACTRAQKSLAIIAYTYDCEAVKATAMKNNWFEDDEIRLLE